MPLACIPIEGCDFGPQNPGIYTHPPGGLPHGPVPSGEIAFGSHLFSPVRRTEDVSEDPPAHGLHPCLLVLVPLLMHPLPSGV